MGVAEFGFFEISDRFVVDIGNHQSIEDLGGNDVLFNRKVTENSSGTTMEFTIPLSPNDPYHYAMRKDDVIYLTLAYSHSDDLTHHSAQRETVKIKL